jgi:hypothetical protein
MDQITGGRSGHPRTGHKQETAERLALEMMHEIRNPLEALSALLYLGIEKADDSPWKLFRGSPWGTPCTDYEAFSCTLYCAKHGNNSCEVALGSCTWNRCPHDRSRNTTANTSVTR